MILPNSFLFNSVQKKFLFNLWQKLSPGEQLEFAEFMNLQEQDFKSLLLEICETNGSFLRNFERIRLTRKNKLCGLAENKQRNRENSNLDALIVDL